MQPPFSEADAGKLLDSLYLKALNGVPKVSKSIEELAEEYLNRYGNKKDAIAAFEKYQIAKCGTSGFITGLGGLITLPVAIPANISSVLYVQLRMVGAIAYMNGYNLHDDEVQTIIYMCLTGSAMTTALKQVGIKVSTKVATATLKKIPGSVLTKINQKVGFRLLTKFGTTGAVNLVKVIPFIGGVVGGGIDIVATKAISANAKKTFAAENLSMTFEEADSTESM